MTTTRQRNANRRNARKSTGPCSTKGKNIVRGTATRHGLLAQEVLLPGEDADALAELGDQFERTSGPSVSLRRCWSTVLCPPCGGYDG